MRHSPPKLTPNFSSTLHFFRRRALPVLLLVATLAGGLSLVILVASVVNSVLIRPLPYGGDPSRLVTVWTRTPTMPQLPVSYPNFLDIQTHAAAFEHLAVSQRRDMVIRGVGDAERVEGIVVSSGYFHILAERPGAGRLIDTSDD